MNTSQFEAKPEEVAHWTPYAHWCANCWHWVVDCDHLADALPVEHHVVNDGWIRSLAYESVDVMLRGSIQMEGGASIPSGAGRSRSRNLENAPDEYLESASFVTAEILHVDGGESAGY